ncbi:MAG: hypothetical protein KC437_06175 [Flavobacteriales bacterium]|nr:hypothetical protein [Flavobacteriales bacterium]
MSRHVIGIVVMLLSSPLFGQGHIYAPIDSLKTMPISRLDSLYPPAFSTDSASNLTTISRPEIDSIIGNAIRPVIYELMRVSEEINAPASSFSYLFYFNANGVLDHARISIILAQEGHSLTIEYPDSILNHLLSNFSLGFSASRAYSQCGSTYLTHDLTVTTISGPKRYLLAYQPGKAQTIYGIAIGIVGQDVICNAPYNQTTNGINLQIGAGLFHWYKIPFRYEPDPHWLSINANTQKSITNGLQCSIFGTQTDVVNGIAISGFVSVADRLNGLALNLGSSHYTLVNGMTVSFRNTALKTNGVQIGIINSSNEMNGVQVGLRNNVQATDQSVLQVGLWNTINGKSFPILNFRR